VPSIAGIDVVRVLQSYACLSLVVELKARPEHACGCLLRAELRLEELLAGFRLLSLPLPWVCLREWPLEWVSRNIWLIWLERPKMADCALVSSTKPWVGLEAAQLLGVLNQASSTGACIKTIFWTSILLHRRRDLILGAYRQGTWYSLV